MSSPKPNMLVPRLCFAAGFLWLVAALVAKQAIYIVCGLMMITIGMMKAARLRSVADETRPPDQK